MQGQLAAYANRAGLLLGNVYIERPATSPQGFEALLLGITRNRAIGVVVPSLEHFGDLADERVAQLEDVLAVVVHAIDAATLHDPAIRSRPRAVGRT